MATYDHDAIYKAYPNVVTIRDQSEQILDKDGNKVTVEQSKVNTARTELDAEVTAKQYTLSRIGVGTKPGELKYPDIGDQLDDLYHKGAFSDEMTAKLKAVKDKYPKP